MQIDYTLLNEMLKSKENKDMTKEQVMSVRNMVAAIRPGCPPKLLRGFAIQVNAAVGKEVVKL